MKLFTLLSLAASAVYATSTNSSTSPIVTTKVTPSYWRATFSSPPFNIQSNAWYNALHALVNEITNDKDVKVVVFDSSVPDFYIGHLDIMNGVSDEVVNGYWPNMTALANAPVLTIAAIRGIARGGGAEFVASLDVSFGSKEKAVLGQFEVGVGGLPGGGGLAVLPRTVGRSRALEIALGGQDFDADTAALYGWINRAIPDAEFDSFVDTFARRVSSWDRAAIKANKEIINQRAPYPPATEQQSDFAAFLQLVASDPNVQARFAKAIELGLQTNVEFELNLPNEIIKLTGQGPWDV